MGWIFRVGLNEHSIRLERNKGMLQTSKLVSVYVDHTLLMKATPADLAEMCGTDPKVDTFSMDFELRGSQQFIFSLFKTDSAGIPFGLPVDVPKIWRHTTRVHIEAK